MRNDKRDNNITNEDIENPEEFFGGQLLKSKLDHKLDRVLTNLRLDIEEIKIFAVDNGVNFKVYYKEGNKKLDFFGLFPSKFIFLYDSLDED